MMMIISLSFFDYSTFSLFHSTAIMITISLTLFDYSTFSLFHSTAIVITISLTFFDYSTLSLLQSTSAEFRTRLSECRRTLQKIGNVRDKYRPVATRGRLLFSTSTALRRLSRNYVFSFQHFLHVRLASSEVGGGRREYIFVYLYGGK